MHSLAWVKENFISINSVSLNPKVTSVCPLLLQVVDFLRGEGFVVVRRLWGYQQNICCRLSTLLLSRQVDEFTSRTSVVVEQYFWRWNEFISSFIFGPCPIRFGQGHEQGHCKSLNFVHTIMKTVRHWWPDPLKILRAEMSFSGRLKTKGGVQIIKMKI